MMVEEHKIGNTIIRIHDDSFINSTQEDIDIILNRIKEIGSRALSKQMEEKRKGAKVV